MALPRDLHVQVVSDETAARVGVTGPQYEPSRHTVYFPWSFLEQLRAELGRLKLLAKATPAQLDQIAQSAMTFVLNHQLAHCLIDVLDIPVAACEEQMADSFASVLAIVSTRRRGDRAAQCSRFGGSPRRGSWCAGARRLRR